jgi:hypothetical protein
VCRSSGALESWGAPRAINIALLTELTETEANTFLTVRCFKSCDYSEDLCHHSSNGYNGRALTSSLR